MKSFLYYYPIIRREFTNIEELGEVINRSASYCKNRLNGKREFTHREKEMIANYLNRPDQIEILFERRNT